METFPKTVELNDGAASLHFMSRADDETVLNFAQALPPHDLMFLRRDITRPDVVSAWIDKIEDGGTL